MPRRAGSRRVSLVVAAAIAVTVGTVPAVPPTNAAEDPVAIGDRLEKALDGQAPYDGAPYVTDGTASVMFEGPDPPDPDGHPGTRAAWMAHFEAHHAPFRDHVTRLVAEHGGTVQRTVAAANTVFAEVRLEAVEAILDADREGPGTIQAAGLDWTGAVEAQNTESVPPTEVQRFHEHGFQGQGVMIAHLDSGIDDRHNCFRTADDESRVVKWKDYINGEEEPYDDDRHGTHTAATAAGSTKAAGCEEPGMAPKADLMGIKIINRWGFGNWSNVQAALEWAFDNGADVATNSWGGYCGEAGKATRDLVNDLAEAGFEQAFAAGNSGPEASSVLCPATARYALTVGATDKNETVAEFSSRGPCDDGTGERVCPDVVAVGVDVRSAETGTYNERSGTSMAVPHVAGGVAVVEGALRQWAQRELLEPGAHPAFAPRVSEAEHLIKDCARDLAEPGPDNATGWGFLKLGCVVDEVRERSRPVVRATATVGDDHLECEEESAVVLRLENVGGQPTDGTARIAVHGPVGEATGRTLLVPFEGQARLRLPVDASMAAGDYDAHAAYAYAWQDPLTGEPRAETVEADTAFQVHKAIVEPLRPLASPVLPGTVFEAGPTIVNAGNAPATGLTVLETVPSAYDVAPRAPGEAVGTVWSHPAPDEKTTRLDGTTYLGYDVGTLGPSEAWSVDYRLLAEVPGDHAITTDVAFSDHGACEASSALASPHTVAPTG